MRTNEQAFRLLCKLADALQNAEDSGSDKQIGMVPREILPAVMCFAGQSYEPEYGQAEIDQDEYDEDGQNE